MKPWQAGMDDLMHPEMVLSRHPAGNGMPVTVAVLLGYERYHTFMDIYGRLGDGVLLALLA